jgi:hypothetical protein
MGVSDVIGGFQARRVFLPSSGVESWLVIGPNLRPVAEVDEYLAWLTRPDRTARDRSSRPTTAALPVNSRTLRASHGKSPPLAL